MQRRWCHFLAACPIASPGPTCGSGPLCDERDGKTGVRERCSRFRQSWSSRFPAQTRCASNPAAERDCGNGEIKNLAKSVFGSPAFHAPGGGAPKPSVSGDESDTKYLQLQPE